MKKKLVAMLCLMVFLCMAMIGTASAANDAVRVIHSGGQEVFDGLLNAITEVKTQGWTGVTYTLLRSFKVGEPFTMENATLDMAGNTLTFVSEKRPDNTKSFVNVSIINLGNKLTISNGVKVTFDNCTINLNYKFIEVQSGGKLYVTNGTTISNGQNITQKTDFLKPAYNSNPAG
ncbi:MAG: hypothetical protein J6B53_05375, partial [Clostridia bacterium]|nr:hypothetical protein [Clostridia bacterium]